MRKIRQRRRLLQNSKLEIAKVREDKHSERWHIFYLFLSISFFQSQICMLLNCPCIWKFTGIWWQMEGVAKRVLITWQNFCSKVSFFVILAIAIKISPGKNNRKQNYKTVRTSKFGLADHLIQNISTPTPKQVKLCFHKKQLITHCLFSFPAHALFAFARGHIALIFNSALSKSSDGEKTPKRLLRCLWSLRAQFISFTGSKNKDWENGAPKRCQNSVTPRKLFFLPVEN